MSEKNGRYWKERRQNKDLMKELNKEFLREQIISSIKTTSINTLKIKTDLEKEEKSSKRYPKHFQTWKLESRWKDSKNIKKEVIMSSFNHIDPRKWIGVSGIRG